MQSHIADQHLALVDPGLPYNAGLKNIRAIVNSDRLATYPFCHAALGEFEFQSGRSEIAREHFRQALALARNPMERRFLEDRTVCLPAKTTLRECPAATWSPDERISLSSAHRR